MFEQVRIDPDTWTLVWPNGADFDPATLHDWPDAGPRMIDMARDWADAEPRAAGERGATRGQLRLIGIDCATTEADRGLALGVRDDHGLRLADATVAGKDRPSLSIVERWLTASEATDVIAIDAPLGWPRPMAETLDPHSAGATIETPPDAMFRRATDLHIKREIGKTPLDVGADRIARTAHAALRLLGRLRDGIGSAIPLAWDPAALDGHAAIEVYPAATLIAHGVRSTRYKDKKKPVHAEGRREIVAALRRKMTIPEQLVAALSDNADVLDAAVCVLAAEDFVAGRATPPPDWSAAEREGWIWTARRQAPAYTAPDG